MIKAIEKAYAKLNLSLEVGGVLENGYHLIKSVMQSISLHDTVTLKRSRGISLNVGSNRVPSDSRNIAYKAAELFFKESGIDGGAEIELKKSIPVCAGLGGGSSDGAAVLRGLNRLYGTPFSAERLTALGASLGADVPFCIKGGTAFATGIGEVLEPLPKPRLFFVLLFDRTPLSTPKMYAALDRGSKSPADAEACRKALLAGDTEGICASVSNSFLTLAKAECEAIERNINALLQNGARHTSITGKGPTVFGVFAEEEEAKTCAEKVRGTFCFSV